MPEVTRRDFVKGLAAMFAVAAAPPIISGVGAAMTNTLTIIRWERVRMHTSFDTAYRMLGQFKYPPHMQPNNNFIYFAFALDDYALVERDRKFLQHIVVESQRNFERQVKEEWDSNCVFKYPQEYEDWTTRGMA